mmetsp:Transcript_5476/g.6307  ORF Transcript_5476/g.6307 Transcript_5476/m.6307 type:complete len:361 (-) Transcript_5476:293-1375(-)|eukprot:CAMPEP_0197844700 /NCGR_PEP_ID=MMETSP1438-20131217/1684_1 /TAXON_ID=1461541 /ORGANISM="Pterosperma sp., Strain CCMP1384" /LENGTH=360 /DNA_ID=CAMNT_0043455637 /DNA_START=120 /DNA_END=1202 /DNA_ORIENTATION=+
MLSQGLSSARLVARRHTSEAVCIEAHTNKVQRKCKQKCINSQAFNKLKPHVTSRAYNSKQALANTFPVVLCTAKSGSTDGTAPVGTVGDAPGKAGKDRPSFAEESRTLVAEATYCHLSTASVEFDGHPYGSMVDIASDDIGRPLFAISQLSAHTRDLQADPRASVTVTATSFDGIKDARVTLVGTCVKVEGEEVKAVKETYLAKHPESFWVEFQDFSLWRMDTIRHVRFVGGFGRAGSVSSKTYSAAAPDPVHMFTPMIAGHMNADHKDAVLAMLSYYGGDDLRNLDDAAIVSIDKLGMDIEVKKEDDSWKQRLGFTREIGNRKEVKDVLVEMTKTAAKAMAAEKKVESQESESEGKDEE